MDVIHIAAMVDVQAGFHPVVAWKKTPPEATRNIAMKREIIWIAEPSASNFLGNVILMGAIHIAAMVDVQAGFHPVVAWKKTPPEATRNIAMKMEIIWIAEPSA